jgi:hypothetical protein
MLDGRADIGIVAGQIDTLGLQAIHFTATHRCDLRALPGSGSGSGSGPERQGKPAERGKGLMQR